MKLRSLLPGILPVLFAVASVPADEPAQYEARLAAKRLRDYPQVHSIVSQMTLEEKVHMLHGTAKFFSGGAERFGVSEVAYADGPLGVREEMERDTWTALGWDDDFATYFPACSALGATWNKQLAERNGVGIGSEARARDKDIILTPAVNIMRTPLCGRTYEYFSEDPLLTKRLAVPYIIGVQSQDVAASVKHYAVNNQESDRDYVSSEADERTLREIYLPAFKAAVQEAGSFTVMGAYNKFRGEFLCENGYMLNTILRGEWGFGGIVVSDWSATHDTVKSALNGLDIEMGTLTNDYNDFLFADPLVQAVRDGKVPESVIDDKVTRLLKVLLNIGKCSPDRMKGSLATDFQTQIAYDTAAESIILLENKNHALPLDLKRIKSVAVIGDNADYPQAHIGFGAGVKPAREVTAFQGIKDRFGPGIEVRYAQGYEQRYEAPVSNRYEDLFKRRIDYSINPELFDEAVKLASECDVAVVVSGSNRMYETESADRPDLTLPFAQEALIQAVQEVNPNTIVVIIAGGAFDLNNLSETVNALLWMSFNGSEHGHALADVLSGKVNPSGKLPFTIPRKLEDMGVHALNAFPGDGKTVDYAEGIHVGYRWLDQQGIDPLYAFGYGLSYTDFRLGTPELKSQVVAPLDTIEITIPVTNIGLVAGKEIVQAYVSKPDSLVERAPRELRAFEKIRVAAGATELCTLRIPVFELAYWEAESRRWVVENGRYEIHLGNSSRNLTQVVPVTVSLSAPPVAAPSDPSASNDVRGNSVGYKPSLAKHATVMGDRGATGWNIRRVSNDSVALSGTLQPAIITPDSGEAVQQADFSALTESGDFYLQVDGVGNSVSFRVSDDVYNRSLELQMTALHGQRCGMAVRLSHGGETFSHGACHRGDAKLDRISGPGTVDGTGGWHDAGDYGKYMVNAAFTLGVTLKAWERFSTQLGQAVLPIPETGGTYPDFLDEMKYELDWMLKNAAVYGDGRIPFKLTRAYFSPAIMPEADAADRYWAPYSSAATADFVAVMALAARVYRPYDADYAAALQAAADKSYAWLLANPDDHQPDQSGFSTGFYPTTDPDDRIWAAAEMWESTGSAAALADFETRASACERMTDDDWYWSKVKNLGMFSYLGSKRDGKNAGIEEAVRSDLLADAGTIVAYAASQGFGRGRREYSWGGNGGFALQGIMLQTAYDETGDKKYLDCAIDQISHIYGRNTYNRSKVTGEGINPPLHPHHRPSEADGITPPWPGLLVGGGWPGATDWEDRESSFMTNETAINWTGAMLYLLGMFADYGQND